MVVLAALLLNAIGQLFFIQVPAYLAELWFPLEKRSLAIGLGFYSNLLGVSFAAILSGLLSVAGTGVTVKIIIKILTIISTIIFISTLFLVKN